MSRQFTLTLVLCGGIAAAGPAAAFTHWNDLRASALLPPGTVTIRTESAQGPGLVNTILYAQGGVQEAPLSLVPDGPSTLEATVPGPTTGRRYYGFRLVQPGALDLLPVRLADGVTPARTDLTRLAVDPVGDEVFGRVNLDLTDCRIGRHGTRLFAALTNAGGGFPVSSGLTFFSYLLGINNPADSDPDTVFALIHTITAAGIIAPGLYQINGTGIDDLVKIGDITATVLPGENTLLLSCELADLEAHPVFQGWYDPDDPRLGVAGFSQRITVLGGAQQADQTPGGIWHLREVALDPGVNQLPLLSDLALPAAGTGGAVSVVYSDADGHCPVIAELVFDGDVVFPLRPQTLDYGAPVVYRSDPDLPPLETGNWAQVAARFSDDLSNVVESTQAAVGVDDTRPILQLRAAPNPFNPTTKIQYDVPVDGRVMLKVYDVRGSLVRTLVDADRPRGSHRAAWDGRDTSGRGMASGSYFARLEVGGKIETVRMSLVR
ncbi:MAG: FlgD immunoglobulin-like domain containing protein [Candidatus Latescibacteria bacterium]|nr:FlgD immunoglobulin-like domain containing protein [Candidatus Latescibacterota bacterium]